MQRSIKPPISKLEFSSRFNEALAWLDSLKVKISEKRLEEYKHAANRWTNYSDPHPNYEKIAELFPDVTSMTLEVPAFIDIFSALKNEKPAALSGVISKLKRSVGGPSNIIDETDTTNDPRNILFELVTTAKFHKPNLGLSAILNSPTDSGFKMEGGKFLIECKRLYSKSNAKTNIEKACSQLLPHLLDDKETRGIVALDLTNLIIPKSPRGEIFGDANQRLIQEKTDKLFYDFIGSNSKKWQEILAYQNEKITSIVCKFSTIAVSKDINSYIYVDLWSFFPREGIDEHEQLLLKKIVSKFQMRRDSVS